MIAQLTLIGLLALQIFVAVTAPSVFTVCGVAWVALLLGTTLYRLADRLVMWAAGKVGL